MKSDFTDREKELIIKNCNLIQELMLEKVKDIRENIEIPIPHKMYDVTLYCICKYENRKPFLKLVIGRRDVYFDKEAGTRYLTDSKDYKFSFEWANFLIQNWQSQIKPKFNKEMERINLEKNTLENFKL